MMGGKNDRGADRHRKKKGTAGGKEKSAGRWRIPGKETSGVRPKKKKGNDADSTRPGETCCGPNSQLKRGANPAVSAC